MTFNDNARLDPSKVKRSRGRTAAGVGVGGGVGVIALFVISQLLGVDLTGLAGGGGSGAAPEPGETIEGCDYGKDANASIDCRMVGAATALDDYWAAEAPALGITDYVTPDFLLFTGQTDTGCGAATSAVGPFYCPPDQTVYLDTGFYDDLTNKYGASGGPLAQLYVVAHEWGHHIQNLTGALAASQGGETGPSSGSVRVELQADCYAGAWAAAASQTEDASGTPFLDPITDEQIADALSAASAVGDDRIQGTDAHSETWTHGSSEKRQQWFLSGYRNGPQGCDTFSPATP